MDVVTAVLQAPVNTILIIAGIVIVFFALFEVSKSAVRLRTGKTNIVPILVGAVLIVGGLLYNPRGASPAGPTLEPDIPMASQTPSSVMETPTPIRPSATFTQSPTPPVVMFTLGPTQSEGASQAVFIQFVTSANMSGNWTIIDNSLASDPNALVFAMPNWNPGEHEVYNKHLVGVLYTGSQWAVINLDMGFMPQNAAFNIQILSTGKNAFVHTATSSNTSGNSTAIDIDNPLASDPNALVFVTPNCSPPKGSRICYNHPIGVWYTGKQWAIFNQDKAPMSEGAAFNIQILSPGINAFVHTATSSNTSGNSTTIADPLAHDPNALIFVMPRSSPGDSGVYNNHPIGVFYTGEQWAVFNEDRTAMPEGAEFNILILQAR